MDQRLEDRIEGWDSKPLTGGFAELRELADGGFSGVARSGQTTLHMLNGRVVGVFGGSIDDFEGADATVYKAPHPSLPLLFAMKRHGGEQQAKYYTNDTPISQAHQQLSDAGFTGYIELSENVLSGDYYVLYYGGRSLSCAFVGNSDRLEVGDEAFELADDEVGIYEVMSVDVEVTDIPEPGGAGGGAGSGTGAGRGAGAGGGTDATGTGADSTPGTSDAPGGSPAGAPGEQDGRGGADPTGADVGTSADTAEPSGGDHAGAEPRGGDQAGADPSGAGGGAADTNPPGGGDTPAGRSADDSPEDDVGAGSRDPTEPGEATPDAESGDAEGPSDAGPEPDAERDRGVNSSPAESPADGGAGTGGGRRGEADRAEPAPAEDSDPPAPSGPGDTSDKGGPDSQRASSTDDRPPAPDEGGDAGGQSPRDEAAADRAVEAASGPKGSSATGAATASDGVPKSQAGQGDLRPIPSLSPDHTAVADPGQERAVTDDGGADRTGGADAGGTGRSGGTGSQGATGASETTGVSADGSVGSTPTRSEDRPGTDVAERASRAVDVDAEDDTEPVPDDAGSDQLRQQLAAREERIEDLEAAITDLRVQRDGLTDERDRLEQEVERLEGEVADLESQVEQLRSRLDDGTRDKQRLSREDALRGTNLFVRYGSKSGGTLDDAHGGEVDKEEVNENLRLEHHTQFDADDVVVGDEPFDQYLRGTIYRQFVEWIVTDLLYEIQDTGHVKGLRELYDAIPQIDRAELLGDVSVEFTEDGEQYREQRSFDVVLRDRMGNPLIVANLNDSRNPADREMMQTVIDNGQDVKASNESLSSAMMVTASFFKPGALEAADEAHGGGLLSRDAKESYVKLTRKHGFHLILVESRGGDFHVNVPEL